MRVLRGGSARTISENRAHAASNAARLPAINGTVESRRIDVDQLDALCDGATP